MTKIYCLKCKEYTETENEDRAITDNGKPVLTGECRKCGKTKCVFTNADYDYSPKKKSARERTEAKIKRKEATERRRAKRLGEKILYADEELQKCVKKCLKEHGINSRF
jgi:hypothetical protein